MNSISISWERTYLVTKFFSLKPNRPETFYVLRFTFAVHTYKKNVLQKCHNVGFVPTNLKSKLISDIISSIFKNSQVNLYMLS